MKTKHDSILFAADAKSCDQHQSDSIRSKWFALALGGFLFTSIFALSAPPVKAQCKQWSVGHAWRFKQGPTPVEMNLQQNGTVVTGTATHNVPKTETYNFGLIPHKYGVNVSGTVDGTVEGDQFAVKIEWSNNTTGVYEGTIGPSGKIEGKGWEIRSPRTKVRWYSETRMVCAESTAVQPPAPPPQTSGTIPTPAPKPPKSTGRPKEAVPNIKANPVAVTIPAGQSHGRTTLTWDGGPDHPDAEVWMKESVGGDKEVLVVQQGKGTRSVTVELGKYYHFILKDAGQELAKAVVLTRQ